METLVKDKVPTPISIDAIADAAARARVGSDDANGPRCDACEAVIEGEVGGHGLFLWMRGDELRIEEPPLCALCATAISVTALSAWSVEEEEG